MTYLEWHDAHTNNGWFTPEQVDRWAESDWVIRECGWVIKETDKFIIFATAWKPPDEWTEEQFCSLHRIPKTWIRIRKLLSPL